MIVARIKLPKLAIPRNVVAASKKPDVDTIFNAPMPMGATCWIACTHAQPHRDTYWEECYFVTLCVKSKHAIGDAETKAPLVPFLPGDVAIVDPRVAHWLMPDDWHKLAGVPWIGLHYEVPRRQAPKLVRDLVKKYNGTWRDDVDPRYSKWVA